MRLDPITLRLKAMVDTKAKRNQYTKLYFFYILLKLILMIRLSIIATVCLADIAIWTHSFPSRTGQ